MALLSIYSSVQMITLGYLHIDDVFNVNCASSLFELTVSQRRSLIAFSTIYTSRIFLMRARRGMECEMVSDVSLFFSDFNNITEWTYQKWADVCDIYGIICKPLMEPYYYHTCMLMIEEVCFSHWFDASAGLPLSISVITIEPEEVDQWYMYGNSLIDQRYDDTKGIEYLTKGIEYLTKAARQDHFYAQCNLQAFLAGMDDNRSSFWLRQSLGQNPTNSANSWEESSAGLPLSVDYTDFLSSIEQQDTWYELGLQARSSPNTFEQQKGIEYLTGAARKGHTSAQYELGKTLQTMDFIDRALFWYNQAAHEFKYGSCPSVAAENATAAIEAINRRPAKRLRN